MNSKDLSSQQILEVPLDAPHKLFTAENLKAEFRNLRSKWHPDHNAGNPEATKVFQHIKELNEVAEKLIAEELWPGPHVLKWRGKDSTLELKYQWMTKIEVGQMYVARKHVAFKLDSAYRTLLNSGHHTLRALRYAGPDMENQFAPMFPRNARIWEDQGVMLFEKTEDVLPLRLVLNHFKGQIPARHVAWMVNRLHNIAAYFEYTGISHQALCVDTLFVSPKYHSILPLGGWWYASPLGRRVTNVPAQLLDYYPAELKSGKEAILTTDQALIKFIGIELLGDPSGTGTRLLNKTGSTDDKIPEAMLSGLRSPPLDSAYKGYSAWAETLKKAYGKRTFVEMDVTEKHVY